MTSQRDQLRIGIRNGFKVDVATKMVIFAQGARHLDQTLHGVVRASYDARAQEQTIYIVAPIKIQRQIHHFRRPETRAWHVAGAPVHAIQAVILAKIGQQYLEQRHAAPVRRKAMANTGTGTGTQARTPTGIPFGRGTAGARGIVLCRIGQNFEFAR